MSLIYVQEGETGSGETVWMSGLSEYLLLTSTIRTKMKISCASLNHSSMKLKSIVICLHAQIFIFLKCTSMKKPCSAMEVI